MFISDFAIARPIITVVTMIALVVFGLAALFRLDTDEFPDLDQPIGDDGDGPIGRRDRRGTRRETRDGLQSPDARFRSI